MYDPAKIQLRKNWEKGAKRLGTAKDIAGYYAAIACLDREIGRLLAKIDTTTPSSSSLRITATCWDRTACF